MASVVGICNLALAHIGQKPISDLNEASENARKCKLVYELMRDALLRDHQWNFARAIKKMTELEEVIPGWSYLYAQPQKCLFVRRVFNSANIVTPRPLEFDVVLSPVSEVKAISTNTEAAWIEYTYQVTDPSLFDPLFTEALSYKIAAAIAKPLTGDIQLASSLLQMFSTIVDKANLQNAKEGSKKKSNYSSLIEAR